MIESIKIEIKDYLQSKINDNTIKIVVEEPKKQDQGDISIPTFSFAKVLKKSPQDCAFIVKEYLDNYHNKSIFSDINVVGGFLNIYLDKQEISKLTVENILKNKDFGKRDIGKDQTVVIDYSSPNIAKPFGIGHLRSTIIGHALKNISKKCSYNVVGINYIGDWGTQFGKVIYAYKKWGSEEKVKKDGVRELVRLYIDYHKLSKEDETLDDEARKIFSELEKGNKEYLELWKWFKEVSLNEAKEVYDLLGVKFDSYNGEAFYNDKMDQVVDELIDKKLLIKDSGANIVDLGDNMPPALIQKSDGSTLYITRDLASVKYRRDNYKFSKALYVVGGEQKLHFNQLKEVVKKMGYEDYKYIEHVPFGLVLKDGKKMGTRDGNSVLLVDVLHQAIEQAKKTILEKNPDLENVDYISEKIGVGAVCFNDLKNFRTHDVEFDLEGMLKFEGQTGPYLQYTNVRINSLLRDKKINKTIKKELFENTYYYELIKILNQYGTTLEKSCIDSAPSYVAKYLLNLSSAFNSYYGNVKILDDNKDVLNTNLMLSKAVKQVLEEGMNILGVIPIEKM